MNNLETGRYTDFLVGLALYGPEAVVWTRGDGWWKSSSPNCIPILLLPNYSIIAVDALEALETAIRRYNLEGDLILRRRKYGWIVSIPGSKTILENTEEAKNLPLAICKCILGLKWAIDNLSLK